MNYRIFLLILLLSESRRGYTNHIKNSTESILVNGCTKFGLNLLTSIGNQLSTNDTGGIFISPYSVWSALLIIYYGSSMNTESELRDVLGLGQLSKQQINEVHKYLKHDYKSYVVASRLYIQRGLQLHSCLSRFYEDSSLGYADFNDDPETARRIINEWIEIKTRNKIMSLLPPNSINSASRLVIVNAVHFQAFWEKTFDASKTVSKPFRVSLAETITVPMMSASGKYLADYDTDLELSILQLPYADKDIAMLILLPEHRFFGLKILEQVLINDNLSKLRQKLVPRHFHIEIPKFRMNTNYDLMPILKSMGLKKVFNNADLPYLLSNGIENLRLDHIRHKAAIEVTEHGTTAAVSTAAAISFRIRKDCFIVDRPFFFVIFNTKTDIPIFMGTVWRPLN